MNRSDLLAIENVNKHGVLLVFPVKNRKEPLSLWSVSHPRTEMRWEWTEDGDDRVAKMWMQMKRLSDCREIVYSKWFQGRATFFSKTLFQAMLRLKNSAGPIPDPHARTILTILEQDSPLSTKELKKLAELQGRYNEGVYSRAMKALFNRLAIVGFGEVEDGAFPSLAVAATSLIYEELVEGARGMSVDEAQTTLDTAMPPGSAFRKFWDRSSI